MEQIVVDVGEALVDGNETGLLRLYENRRHFFTVSTGPYSPVKLSSSKHFKNE